MDTTRAGWLDKREKLGAHLGAHRKANRRQMAFRRCFYATFDPRSGTKHATQLTVSHPRTAIQLFAPVHVDVDLSARIRSKSTFHKFAL